MKSQEAKPGTALVTGASSGIGLELARELAANGHPLIIVARDRQRLAAVADELRSQYGVDVVVQASDLSAPGAAEALWSTVAKAGVEVDILVNNAGIGVHGELQDQPIDELTRMQMVNVVAL